MTANDRPQVPSDPASAPETSSGKGNSFFGDSLAAPGSNDLESPKPPRSPGSETDDTLNSDRPEMGKPDLGRPDPYARPMSERQRRRLAEQQSLAERRAAEAEKQTGGFLSPLAESADAPPATVNNTSPAVKATKAQTKTRTTKVKTKKTGSPYLLATLASALWAGGIASFVAYEYGSGMLELDPVQLCVFIMLALAPVGLFYLMAHMLRLASSLATESRRARELADAMVAPTMYATQEAGSILSALRGDIETTQELADRARQDLTALREAFASESTRLGDAARTAQASTQNITMQLGKERDQLTQLGQSLGQQAVQTAEAVNRQAQMVADASDLAQALLREAEAALAARAADLAAAANEAQDAARVAAEDLSRQTLRLETAGTSVTEQIKTVEDGLSQQRASLATAAYALRTDQEDFAAQIESQRVQFIDQLSLTRSAASDLNQTGDQIAEGIKAQVEAVLEQFRALVTMSQTEAEGFDAATKLSLDKYEDLAAQCRDRLLDETRRAVESLQHAANEQRTLADQALQQAQIRADRLGESLFDAARQADEAAEARIEGARRIVAETVQLVDQAGSEAATRVETLTRRMTDALSRIEASVREMDERTARMPEEAAQHVANVRNTVEQGLASLSDASRRAAADTEALDAGFQDRVRRNYEMLTEAARLLGTTSEAPAPTTAQFEMPAKPAAPTMAAAPMAQPVAQPVAQPIAQPLAQVAAPAAAFSVAPISAPTANSIADSGISWRDIAQNETPVATPAAAQPAVAMEVLIERATAAIRRLGVDPNALLPRARIEDVAYAFSRNDLVRARQIVRRVAPAAVRSVSRRLEADTEMRNEVLAFITQFSQLLSITQGERDMLQMRLATDEGRAFMLFDAALGEMV